METLKAAVVGATLFEKRLLFLTAGGFSALYDRGLLGLPVLVRHP